MQQVLAFDHHQDVELARRKAPGDVFVLLEFGGVGAKQLAQRIVDLETVEPEYGGGHEYGEDDRAGDRRAQRDQPDALQAVGQRMQLAHWRV